MLNIISIPFGYLMRFFYLLTSNYAVALILFALVVKLLMLPLTIHQRKSSVTQARLRPKERAIRKRYEGRTDMEARVQMATELQAMYKEEKYSVAGGCLPLLIQFPIIIALYNIVRQPLTYISRLSAEVIKAVEAKALELIKAGSMTLSGATAESKALSEIQLSSALNKYPELFGELVSDGTLITNFNIFGMDLSATPTLKAISLIVIFPILAGVFQWVSSFVITKLMPAPQDSGEKTPEVLAAERTMKNMNVIMPILTVFIAFSFPAVMSLYWVYQSILGALFTVIVYKLMPLPVYTEEEYQLIERELNKDYVPIPVSRASGSGRSLHRIDEEDDENSETITVTDFREVDETESTAAGYAKDAPVHRGESAPRVRHDKNGNPIRSLHYIDFDEEDEPSVDAAAKVGADSEEKTAEVTDETNTATDENESIDSEETTKDNENE